MKNRKILSTVNVYYDETKISQSSLNGHVLYFLPKEVTVSWEEEFFGNIEIKSKLIKPAEILCDYIDKIRTSYQCGSKFHFSQISGHEWGKRDRAHLEIMNLGIDSLKQRDTAILNEPLFAKLAIIFYPESHDMQYYGGRQKKEKRMRYEETVFRMLLKGAVHYLYKESHNVKIEKIICDNPPFHREFDEDRILWRLIEDHPWAISSLRSYVNISQDAKIVEQNSNHREFDKDTLEYRNANILQVTDMLLGGISYCLKKSIPCNFPQLIYGNKVGDKQAIMSIPIKNMFDKIKRGNNFKYSSHYGSFSVSKAYIENSKWVFQKMSAKEIGSLIDPNQSSLFPDAF